MDRLKRVIVLMLVVSTLLSACGKGASAKARDGIDVDITEKMYVAYINEVYTNSKDYIGKTIRIQGMFSSYYDSDKKETDYFVYRVGPGCCGNDGAMCGFQMDWDGDLPQDNDWIEVVGKLESHEDDTGVTYLTLNASSVTVMDKRGKENVFQ